MRRNHLYGQPWGRLVPTWVSARSFLFLPRVTLWEEACLGDIQEVDPVSVEMLPIVLIFSFRKPLFFRADVFLYSFKHCSFFFTKWY